MNIISDYIVKVTALNSRRVVMVIYMVTNKVNGKSYVGQTINSLEQRKGEHVRRSSLNNDNLYFHNALRKYGADLFEWIVIDRCDTIERLNELEIFYIGLYDTFDNGYNLTIGGNNAVGCKHTEKTKQLLSSIKKGKFTGKDNSMYGKSLSKETRKKISDTFRNKR
jgi:group I intron endonuclease